MLSWFNTGYRVLWGLIGAVGLIVLGIALVQSGPGQSLIGGRLAGDTLSRSDWSNLLSESAGAVYLIETLDCEGNVLGNGTGFLAEDWLVTNGHVIEDASRVTLRSQSGKQYEAIRWSVDSSVDLGILNFDFGSNPQLELAYANPIEGALIATVGHPLGGELEIRDGRFLKYVDGENIERYGSNYLGLTAEALPGDSGGPAIGSSGEVLGVTSALLRKDNLTLAIPVEEVSDYLLNSPNSTFTFPCETSAR